MRDFNNLTTLTAGSEEERKSLLKRVKEKSEKAGLKLNIQKMKILANFSNKFSGINLGMWKCWMNHKLESRLPGEISTT